MRLAVRWTAVVLVVAALGALWLRFHSRPESEAARPRASGVADSVLPQSQAASPAADFAPQVVLPDVDDADLIGADDEPRAQPSGPDRVYLARVVDAQTREPIAGAVVTPARLRRSSSAPTSSLATTDQHGQFEIRLRSGTPQIVRVDADGYARALAALERNLREHAAPTEIALTRAAAAEVVVATKGGAAAGAYVWVSTHMHRTQAGLTATAPLLLDADPTWTAIADEQGVARIEGLPSYVSLYVEVAHGGRRQFTPHALALEPGQTKRVDVRLDGEATIRGHIECGLGGSVSDVELWLVVVDGKRRGLLSANTDVFANARSDEHGNFVFPDVSTGDWFVGIAPPRPKERLQSLAPVAELVRVLGSEGEINVVLRSDRALFLRGRVVDHEGRPARARATAHNMELSVELEANSQSDGVFELGPLPNAEYQLVARSLSGGDAEQCEASVRPADTDVVLRLGRGGRMAVRIAPEDGEHREATLCLGRVGSPLIHQLRTRNGVRIFDSLVPGEYHVSARTDDGFFAMRRGVQVSADEQPKNIVLTLSDGAFVDVQNAGPELFALCRLLVDGVVVDCDTVLRGSSAQLVGPPGSVEFTRSDRSGSVAERHVLTLAPGEVKSLVLGK